MTAQESSGASEQDAAHIPQPAPTATERSLTSMVASMTARNDNDCNDVEQQRALKKPKLNDTAPCAASASEPVAITCKRVLTHPYGIKPIGNFYEDMDKGIADCRAPGLGKLAFLSDMQMLSLLNYLPAKDLCVLGECSRFCYVFSSHDELWRTLVLEEMEGAFQVEDTWKDSYVTTKCGGRRKRTPIPVQGFYSDLLFQSFYCAAAPIENSWIAVENIDRRSANELSLKDFKRDYEIANRPVILTEAIDKWPAIEKWTDEYLIKVCEGQTFIAGGFDFPMDKYLHHSRTLMDDQPLFIFDKFFVDKVPSLAEDYDVPKYFQEDFFSLLGEQRPDYRWLIIGPKKSGSTFHIDPNSTNAWNGVIRGSKKWIMFPPEIVPPGVHPSEDGGDVSTPVSLMEWFVTFYPQIRKLPSHMKPLEGICREGEIMFVPHGWWHLVLNLDESIAITQNFACTGNLKGVLRFLQDKPDQVSGLSCEMRPQLNGLFHDALKTHQPELFARVTKELDDEYERKHRKSKWELLLQGDQPANDASQDGKTSSSETTAAASFSFGFGFQFDE
uniref:JmjC domain-containing protein n=1 Tax=Globisporangium ultimum (strain ATCC 200006 / CBS 805.95 / DAOM BR144) TaxID=431595 RepID=K3X1S1_GLOUD